MDVVGIVSDHPREVMMMKISVIGERVDDRLRIARTRSRRPEYKSKLMSRRVQRFLPVTQLNGRSAAEGPLVTGSGS